jgi:hypothetical protein
VRTPVFSNFLRYSTIMIYGSLARFNHFAEMSQYCVLNMLVELDFVYACTHATT